MKTITVRLNQLKKPLKMTFLKTFKISRGQEFKNLRVMKVLHFLEKLV